MTKHDEQIPAPDPYESLAQLAADLDKWAEDDRLAPDAHADALGYVGRLREGLDALLSPVAADVALPELDALLELAGPRGRLLAACVRDADRRDVTLVGLGVSA